MNRLNFFPLAAVYFVHIEFMLFKEHLFLFNLFDREVFDCSIGRVPFVPFIAMLLAGLVGAYHLGRRPLKSKPRKEED